MGITRALAGLIALVLASAAFQPVGAQTSSHPQASAPKTAIAHRAGGHLLDAARPIDLHPNYIDHIAGEPTMGVDHDGDAFIAAADAISFTATVPRVDVLRSSDGGSEWDVVSPALAGQNLHASTGDPYVYVDAYQDQSRVFTVDLQGYVCSLLSFSDDDGKSWTTNPFGCGRPYGDHQTLFSAPPVSSATVGYPNLIYYCYQDVVSSSCSKSLDGGVSFVPTGTLSFPGFEGTQFCGGLHGHGFGAEDGSIYIPKVHCGQPWLAISRDEGATWTRTQVAKMDSAGHEASVALDNKGNIYYAYIGAHELPYLAVSRDGGKSWGAPMMVGSPGVSGASLPSLDVGPHGEVVVGYMGTESLERGASQTWNGYVTVTKNALARKPLFLSAQTNHDHDPLIRGACEQVKCGPVFDFIDVVIDDSGDVWGAFVDGCTDICSKVPGSNNDGAGLVIRWNL
jgi:hypothetical protein